MEGTTMERTRTSTALIAAAATLLAVPLFTAQAARAEPASSRESGGGSSRVHLEARDGSASTVTFDDSDTRPTGATASQGTG
ncbi:hypothetical protein C5C31_02885 [Rathayibacter rathayi]|uniref:Uncharacterized protein n=2 Tax=Rathayibacter rathayi TaxID=33887 RepID=A0ABD6WAU9_RATRA|nr:hypothetical protein C1O28_00750 [Rathayibacter rathayi]PPF15547.1 hypothetical protein C5C04_03150 [Rathayibacter rathayi]PPF51311.1 hypothetical protein C5C08_02650 [Rathayibacter rathayi]PPF80393.1 hypothetical protein C5C14_06710 [Rathayibacter rathayi]PPG11529.1 hypothetical protein C5C11_12285 [Rathayibacter rathayi]